MGNPHLHIAFIEEGSELLAVPGLGVFAVLRASMQHVHGMRKPASAQIAMYCSPQTATYCRPSKVSVSAIMYLDGSFIMLLSFIALPGARRIHPQLLFRDGSIQVWDWSLPAGHLKGRQTAVRPLSNDAEVLKNMSLWKGIPTTLTRPGHSMAHSHPGCSGGASAPGNTAHVDLKRQLVGM